MDPRKFCELAGHLAVRSDAAAHRSAISRAYYSLFHVVLQYMLKVKMPLPKKLPEGHETVYRLLYSSNDPILMEVARHLHGLHVRRNDADYDLDEVYMENSQTAMKYVEVAQRATDQFDQCCQDPTRMAQAMDNVRRYATNVLKLK